MYSVSSSKSCKRSYQYCVGCKERESQFNSAHRISFPDRSLWQKSKMSASARVLQLKLACFLSKSNTEDKSAKQILHEPSLFGCIPESEQHIPVSIDDGLEDEPLQIFTQMLR